MSGVSSSYRSSASRHRVARELTDGQIERAKARLVVWQQVLRFRVEGLPRADIAARLGLGVATVQRRLRELGIFDASRVGHVKGTNGRANHS